jgi:hypothetical protein
VFRVGISSIEEKLYIGITGKVLSGDTEYTGKIHGLNTQGRILLSTFSGMVEVLSGELHRGCKFIYICIYLIATMGVFHESGNVS